MERKRKPYQSLLVVAALGLTAAVSLASPNVERVGFYDAPVLVTSEAGVYKKKCKKETTGSGTDYECKCSGEVSEGCQLDYDSDDNAYACSDVEGTQCTPPGGS